MPVKRKRIEHPLIYTKDPPPIPHHHFEIKKGIFTCFRCGFVLGGGSGSMPKCYEANEEEKEKNTQRYRMELAKYERDEETN